MGEKRMLMVSEWPKIEKQMADAQSEKDFSILRDLIVAIRNVRSGFSVPPKEALNLTLRSGTSSALLLENSEVLKRLARLGDVRVGEKPQGAVAIMAGGIEAYLELGGMIDLAKEKTRLEKEIASAVKYVAVIEGRLGNKDFVARAPAEIVAEEQKKLEEGKARLASLEAQMRSLE